jgi:hypothetical protein
MKTIIGIEKFWTLFIGLGAVWGAMMMWIDPTGVMWGMDLMLELLHAKMPWPDIFFRNFIPSSFVLLVVNGITQFIAAYLLFKSHRWAQPAVLACGIILMLWISLEWWIWGFNAICNTYFAFGLIEAVLAIIGLKKQQ